MMGPVALLVGEEGVAAEIAMPLVTVKEEQRERRKTQGSWSKATESLALSGLLIWRSGQDVDDVHNIQNSLCVIELQTLTVKAIV
jgi:hypothetical protein